MKRSKLIPILRTFSKDEIREFDKFLNSPFFGCKKYVLNFYRTLVKFYPEFAEDDIHKENIFRILYGDKKYNDAFTRKIISDLIRYSEEYLKYKNFKGKDIFQNSCILNELRIRNLNDQFRVRSESILKKIITSETINTNLLLETYFVDLEVKEFRTFLRDSKMHETYGEMVEAFIVYFLRLFYFYINHANTFSGEYLITNDLIKSFLKNFDYSSFLKNIEKDNSRYSNYIKMIFYVFNIVSDLRDRESYYKLMELLENNQNYFTKNELKNIYVIITRFYYFQNEKYDNVFLKETYNLYNLFLTEYFLPDNEVKLQMSFCRNYINICRQYGDIEKIKRLHKKHKELFPVEYRDDLINLCEAVYLFEKKKFERSLTCAAKVNIDIDNFKLDVKLLKIKNYYELGYIESVYSEIDNMKHFLRSSKKIKHESVLKGKKLIKHFTSLLKITQDKNFSNLIVLKKQIEKGELTGEKKWLLSKINELEFRNDKNGIA